MTQYITEFQEGGYYDNGKISVEVPGSSINMQYYAFNVTPHGGIERPKHRDGEAPRQVWAEALDCLLENVPQDISPEYRD